MTQVNEKDLAQARAILENNGNTFDGYMGAIGWDGVLSDALIDVCYLNKEVKRLFKALHPEAILKAKASKYAGGQSSAFTLVLPSECFVSKFEYIENEFRQHRYSYDWVSYTDENGGQRNIIKDDATDEDFRISAEQRYDYRMEELDCCELQLNQYYIDNEAILNYAGKKIVKELIKIVDAYNYDDSNSQVDYYDTNFYAWYRVGKKGK